MRTVDEQRRTWARAERTLKAKRGAEWLATMTSGHAPSNLMRRSRELRDEHRAEMRDAIRVVRDDGRKGAEVSR